MPGLFNKKILKQRIKNYSIDNIKDKIEKIKNWQNNLQRIKGLNEKRLQAAFLGAIFEDILGYKNTPYKDEWTMEIECSTDLDASTPDGILGYYQRIAGKEEKDHQAVIELKGPQVSLDKDQKRKGTTYKSPVDQAFSYTNKLDKCKWVIVSNFTEIRLYQVGRSKEFFEIFYLSELDNIEEFKKFHYLLCEDSLMSREGKSLTLQLTEATQKREEDISVTFYNLYKKTRITLFEHLKENNKKIESEKLLEKAQKFLDRIIFICFCEDKGLLPNNLLHNAIDQAKNSYFPSDTPIWDQIRGVFRAIDKGKPDKNINAYNGGLFKYDEILDALTIQDDFFNIIYEISDYDFESDVDVNILGHIFEQSITDIEKLKSEIKENEFDKNKSKRKKEGIYYTPQYITSYIVENAVGGYLKDIKKELGYYNLPDVEEAGSKSWETQYTNDHLDFYNNYEEKLKNVKILDPACGSGAFLNQAFDYLLQEHQWLNKQRDLLKGGQSSIYAVERGQRNILKDNLYGVDLNEESVEITKLSLWLKTANKQKPLSNLDDNIKCGNSLIDDPEVAGDKAFAWKEEFSAIMKAGGFDVVIGNPPYVNIFNLPENKRKYFQNKYYTSTNKSDLYSFFIEKVIKNILSKKSFFGFIVSNTWTSIQSFKNLRKVMLENLNFNKLVPLTTDTFEDAMVTPIIFIATKNAKKSNSVHIDEYKDNKFINKNIIPQRVFQENQDYIINFNWSSSKDIIFKKIEKNPVNLGEICKFSLGIKTANNNKFIKSRKENKECFPVIKGKNIQRYFINYKGKWIWYNPQEMKKKRGAGPRKKEFFLKTPKIVLQEISGDKIIASLDTKKLFALDTVNIIYKCKNKFNMKYILALLNSKLINFWYGTKYKGVHVKLNELRKIPIKNYKYINQNKFNNKVDLISKNKEKLKELEIINYENIIKKYTSETGLSVHNIFKNKGFINRIYSGRASKIRNFTVNINTNIVTIYSDKSGNGKYELLKFEENNEYKRRYLKLYLENLTTKKLEEINNKYKGNVLKKALQIIIPDYNKNHVVKKVVKEWEKLQREITELENKIERTDNEIDQMVYNLYDLTKEEIRIIENFNK